MLYFYLVASVALIPLLNNFFDILRQPYSIWLVPLLFVGFFIGFLLLHAIVLFFSVVFIRLDSPQGRFSNYIRTLVTVTLRLIIPMLGVKIHSSGKEKVPENGRMMLVCNHLDNIDPAVILNELPQCELAFIAKKEVYETMPFVAKVLHKLHGMPIDRENNREAAKTVITAIKKIKEDVASVAVFPEGYCSKTGELLPLRNGVFKIAQKAGVPIVVCVIADTPLFLKQLFRKRTHIYFDVVETIPAEKVAEMSTAEIGDYVHKLMYDAIEEIKQKKVKK